MKIFFFRQIPCTPDQPVLLGKAIRYFWPLPLGKKKVQHIQHLKKVLQGIMWR